MQAISTRPFSVCYTGSDIQCTCRMRSGDDIKIPPERRGFGDVWLIPRASLTLSAFWREISKTISGCKIGNSVLLQHDDTACFGT